MSASRSSRRAFTAIAAVLGVLSLVAGGLLLTTATAQADPVVLQPGQLVVNGDAEQLPTVGWTGSLLREPHGSGGYPKSVEVDSSGLTGATFNGGGFLFTGSGGSSVATQTISLAPSAAAIDNGHVDADLSAEVGGFSTQNDNATLTYDFLDASGNQTTTATVFGPVLPVDRGDAAGFVPFSAVKLLPVGTRSVLVTIATVRSVSPDNDGYVDNVSLILDAPSPVATPDTATTPENTPVAVQPLTNDTAGAGATTVPSSVRLLDGVTPVTSLTTADGSYAVNTVTGVITFTPATGFVGAAPAVDYTMSDSSGQTAESTVTITVTFVAAPNLTIVKSATPSDAAAYVAGTLITYNYAVQNTGNVTIDNVTVNDGASTGFTGTGMFDSGPTCPQASLAPGAQENCTATYTLTADDVNAGSLSNSATAQGTTTGGTPVGPTPPSNFTIPVIPAPSISLTKSVTPSTVQNAGDAVTYSFQVLNTGNVSVHGVNVIDALPGLSTPSCPAVTLLPGASETCTASYHVTQSDIDAGRVTNTANATALDPADAPLQSNASTAIVSVIPQPALSFEKTADRNTVSAAGQLVNYSFVVHNTGNVTLHGVNISDTGFTGAGVLGPITCPTNTIAPAASVTCTASYTTLAADIAATSIENTATAGVIAPDGTALTSTPSTFTVTVAPVVVTPPPSTPSNPIGTALAFTGAEVGGPTLTAAALLLAGLSLFTAALSRRIRRQRKTES